MNCVILIKNSDFDFESSLVSASPRLTESHHFYTEVFWFSLDYFRQDVKCEARALTRLRLDSSPFGLVKWSVTCSVMLTLTTGGSWPAHAPLWLFIRGKIKTNCMHWINNVSKQNTWESRAKWKENKVKTLKICAKLWIENILKTINLYELMKCLLEPKQRRGRFIRFGLRFQTNSNFWSCAGESIRVWNPEVKVSRLNFQRD